MREIFGRLRPQADPIELQTAGSTPATPDTRNVDIKCEAPNDNATAASVQTQPRVNSEQDTRSNDELIRKDTQAGVQKIEATTQVWSKKHLLAAYVM